jgi:hypothetical protein
MRSYMTMAPATARLMQNRGDADDMIAPGDHRRRQRAALGAEHIGGIQRVAEARQLDRLLEQLHADQGAALGQAQLFDRFEAVQRQLLLRMRGVGGRVPNRVMGIDQKHETRPEGMRRADQVAQVHGLADSFRPDAEIAAHRLVPTKLNHQRSQRDRSLPRYSARNA